MGSKKPPSSNQAGPLLITTLPVTPGPAPRAGFFWAQDVTKDLNICKAPYHHFALSQRGKVLEART